MVRVLAVVVLVLAGSGSRVLAADGVSEAVPVPGGTAALSRAIGLATPPEASRFFAEITRLTHGIPEGHAETPASTLSRLTAHLDATDRLQKAAAQLPDSTVTLTMASGGGSSRERLKDVLEVAGLRLVEERGKYSVDASMDRTAVARGQLLAALGLKVDELASRLNAGESVRFVVPTEDVPIPLNAKWWSETILDRPTPPGALFAAIALNPRAALLGHGLAGLDDETLGYIAGERRLSERLADDSAIFASFSSHLRIRDGRIVPPGGAATVPLWEAVVGETMRKPGEFIRALFSNYDGRVAYLFDLVGDLDQSRAAFVLGRWKGSDREQVIRFQSLASAVSEMIADWQIKERPFVRPDRDLSWLLLNLPVDPDGTPRGLVARSFWQALLDGSEVPMDPAEALKLAERRRGDPGVVDAAFLVEALLAPVPLPGLRAARFQQLAFGFRAFQNAGPDVQGEVLTAIRALPDYPALVLTIERAGVTSPAVFASAVRRARQLSEFDGAKGYMALSQFQGAMAVVASAATAGSLETPKTTQLMTSLAAVPLDDNSYGTRLADWVRTELLPALPERDSAEAAVLAAVAGVRRGPSPERLRVEWEGDVYRLDLPGSTERRLQTHRERQRTLSIDVGIGLAGVFADLQGKSVSLDAIKAATARLEQLKSAFVPWTAPAGNASAFPPGVDEFPDARQTVDHVIKDLLKITKPGDAGKASRIVEPLADLSGLALGDALGAIAYALQLGEPEDSARLDANLSRRHDFGFGLKQKADRDSTRWLVPRQVVEPGAPRRVMGSLFALDVAFASLTLRRATLDRQGPPSTLLSNDRDTFTKSVALMNPYVLRDADRDRIADTVGKGRARVAAATSAATIDAIADEVQLDGWRRRALHWEAAHTPRKLVSFFSLGELLILGGGRWTDFDSWGMSSLPLSGCLCTRLAGPNAWRTVAGRPQAGAMSTAVPDLNLQVAVMLSTLKLPAQLAKVIAGAAVQDFVERARPNDPADWLTLARQAGELSQRQVEDFVALTTAKGPLVPDRGEAAR